MSYIVLFVFWLIFFFPIFQGYNLFDDTIEAFYPSFYFLTESLKSGKIPLFNPYMFSSYPFINNTQFFEFNPAFIFRTILGTINNSLYWFNLLVSINYLFSMIFFFLYLKNKLKFNKEVSIFGAIVFALSSCYVLTIIHPHTYDFIIFIPLILYFLDDKPYISAIFMGFALHSGHPQKPLYLLILIFFIYLFRKEILKLLIFMLIFSPFLIAFYFQSIDLFLISKRIESDIKFLTEMSYHFDKLITLIIPNFYGSILEENYIAGPYYFWTEMTFYFSVIAIVLAVIGAISSYRDKFVLSLIFSAIFLYFIALGDQNPVIKYLYSEEIIKGIRHPSRALFIYPVIVSVLACYGISYLLNTKKINYLNISALSIFMLFLIFIPFIPKEIDISGEIFKFFIFFILTYVVVYGFVKNVINKNIFLASCIMLAFLDLYLFSNSYLKREVYENVHSYYKPDFIDYIRPDKIGEYRINARFYGGLALPRNSGNINKLELTEGYDPLVSKFYMEFYDYIIKRKEGFENLLRMANVKYYISENGFSVLDGFLPRAYLVYCAKIIKDSFEFFSNVKYFEPKKCVYLQEGKTFELEQGYKDVKILEYDLNKIVIEYETEKDAVLVLSNSYYPYWKAKVNNKEVKVLRANWTFMAIEVEKGKGKAIFYYDTTKIILGFVFYVIGVFLGLAISFLKWILSSL